MLTEVKRVNVVRSLFYNTSFYLDGYTEEIKFMYPTHHDKNGNEIKEMSSKTTDNALMNFMQYYNHQIKVVKQYLINNRNNKTHQWKFNIFKWMWLHIQIIIYNNFTKLTGNGSREHKDELKIPLL